MCSRCEILPVLHEGYTRQPRSCQYSSARTRRVEQGFRIYVESGNLQGMSHVRLLAAALVLVGPAMASAQPAAFAPATQSLAQSALTRNNNDFAGAVRQMGAALAEWDQPAESAGGARCGRHARRLRWSGSTSSTSNWASPYACAGESTMRCGSSTRLRSCSPALPKCSRFAV